MCIVTGPNTDISIKLIKRLKQFFERKLGLIFNNKETVLELNGCQIEAYHSNHLPSFSHYLRSRSLFKKLIKVTLHYNRVSESLELAPPFLSDVRLKGFNTIFSCLAFTE